MGTDVKIGLAVGLALLVVIILYFGAKSDDQAESLRPDTPAVTTRPATAVKQVAIKPDGQAGKSRIIKTETKKTRPARRAEAATPVKPVVAKPPVPVIAKAARPADGAKNVPAETAKARPIVKPVLARTNEPAPAPSRKRRPIEPIVARRPHVERTKPGIYTVKDGDAGFWGIAQKVYGDGKYMDLIKAANPKVDPHKLRAGQKLVTPPLTGGDEGTAAAPKAPKGYDVYTVRKGDGGFWGIAKIVYGQGRHWPLIARANPSVDSSALQPGQKLLIPPLPGGKKPVKQPANKTAPKVAATGGNYTVQAGDDRGFWGIAEKVYGDGKYVYLLVEANPQVDPSKLQVGQKLVVPPLKQAERAGSRLPSLQRAKDVSAERDGRPIFD